jgi:hypothetical protein
VLVYYKAEIISSNITGSHQDIYLKIAHLASNNHSLTDRGSLKLQIKGQTMQWPGKKRTKRQKIVNIRRNIPSTPAYGVYNI